MQNITATGEYSKAALAGAGTTAKGFALSATDKLRAHAIATLLCRFRLEARDLAGFGAAGRALMGEAAAIALTDADGLTEMRDGVFSVTERGRPFVRAIAARFDTYLGAGAARHSAAV
ncbi:oxygen-independent coproporphyrinogen III oxidase [compost metagenome]